ncbi:MAG: phosphoglycerate mutase family protein [Balneolaceae bacterium]
MKPIFLLFICLLVLPSCTPSESHSGLLAESTFILVRHAEKADNSEDPDLSAAGYERADRLAEMLSNFRFDAVYSTSLIRTQKTAAPVAAQNGLPVQEYSHREFDTLIPGWLETHKGQTVFITGHSNSTPTAANGLLGREHFSEKFDESDFGNILIITIPQNGEPRLMHLRY